MYQLGQYISKMVGGDNVIKKIVKGEKGQSLVEFALVVPLLLTILCGIIDMGWAYSNQYSVESAAYAGVRYAAINGADIKKEDENKLIEDTKNEVKENLSSGAQSPEINVFLEDKKVTVNVKCKVKMLTFVGQTAFGEYYDAKSKNVGAR